MRFYGEFKCDKCGERFTMDFGPNQMEELKRPKKIGEFIGETAIIFARSCSEHEKACPGIKG
jgi:hypothetical protein